MKNFVRFKTLVPLTLLVLLPLACTQTYSVNPVSPSAGANATNTPGGPGPSPTFTYTPGGPVPTATFTPVVPTATHTPNPTSTFTPSGGTPTYSPTPSGTFTPPMGLWVVGAYVDALENLSISGISYSVTLNGVTVDISVNHNAETTDGVTFITPLNGSIPVTYTATANMGTYSYAEYTTAVSWVYVVNDSYSLAVSSSLGTATASVNAPGDITIASNGSTASAVYPGTYQAAVVESASTGVTTYVSPTGTSVGSPYTYPSSAYPYSSPATYYTAYSAGVTDFSVTGPNVAAGSAWVGDQVVVDTTNR